MSFDDIPYIIHEPVRLSRNNVSHIDENFAVSLEKIANTLIFNNFPLVASFTLSSIDSELSQSVEMKRQTLEKLKNKYNKRSKTVNIVHDIIMDDFNMIVDGDINLITDAHADLIKSTEEKNIIQIIMRNFENIVENKAVESHFENLYNFLRTACNNNFTKLEFTNEKQNILDQHMIYRIVQVWEIFQQYFKQFDYEDYLKHYYEIEKKSDTKFIISIIRILLDIGPIKC